MQDLFPDSEFYSTDSVCIFMLEQHYFYYCSFEIGDCVLKLGGVSPPTLFFFFFSKFLIIQRYLQFHVNFRISFPIPGWGGRNWNVYSDGIPSVDFFGIIALLRLPTCEHSTSFPSSGSSFISFSNALYFSVYKSCTSAKLTPILFLLFLTAEKGIHFVQYFLSLWPYGFFFTLFIQRITLIKIS